MPTKQKTQAELDIAQDPSIFSMSGEVEFADKDDPSKGQNIRLKLYDGSINQHWYYGALAFDLATMKLEKRTVPILHEHDTGTRLGIGKKATFDGEFILEGPLLKTSAKAKEIKAEADEGFPFEGSLRYDPDRAKFVKLAEGEKHEINGRTMTGPGYAIYNTIIKEGSVCTFGALKGCRSQVFNHQKQEEKEHTMLTLDKFKADNEALYKEVFALGQAEGQTKGEANERAIFAELRDACGDDDTLLVACYSDGKTVADAFKMRAAKMKEANDALVAELALAKKTPPPAGDAAADEFSDAEEKQKKAAALALANKNGGDAFDAKAASDDELKAHFHATQDLKDQFSCADAYVASVKHA